MRHECGYKGWEFVTWLDADGNAVDTVDDRFNSRFIMRDRYSGETYIPERTIAQDGIGFFSLPDVDKLGFTGSEYQVMLRYIFNHDDKDCVESEEHLRELITPLSSRPSLTMEEEEDEDTVDDEERWAPTY
ncbi:hypothetical protein [Rhizobium ruizarguesonis]|uniref:hypothetical protein n=1 Tax=Rhizobium ruizarguesonis TaxID=2081791 RepID=UPI001031975F|nr:hypothetical protein [Rhizobium ruizarguesonis]TBD47122.1 hypothetical protein ELH17_08515 [Rhizobium ruizarguesonis]